MSNQTAETERHTGRKWGVSILILLGIILMILANVTFWAYFTLLNTNGWVTAVGSLSKDPEVAELISQYVVSDLFEQTDIEETLQEALPTELQLFSGPLILGLEQVVDQVTTKAIMSDAFSDVWSALNRVSHTVVMDVLKGDGNRLYFQDGNLTLDFNDIYNFLEDRLGIEDLNLLPQTEDGRFVLLQSRQVAILQEIVSYLTMLGLLLPLLTILVFAAAVWVSLWRRQTVMWIGVAMTVAMLVSLIVFSGVRSSIMISIQDPFIRDLVRAMINVLTQGLMVQTLFFLFVGILIIIGAWQVAPNSALRTWEASRRDKQLADAEQESETI